MSPVGRNAEPSVARVRITALAANFARADMKDRVFMRIVSWNILDGGEGRADPIAEVILAQRPDVVALIEADNQDVLERIATRLNMDYVRGEGAGRHAVAVLSRWTIVHSINHALLRQGPPCLMETLIREPGGVEWTIAATHFHPYAFEADERQRQIEAAALLDIFRPHRQSKRPHLLAGDFNANSPIQDIDPDRCKDKTRQAWRENGGQIPRRVVQSILDAGYLDSYHLAVGDAARSAGTFSTQQPGQRVDYIFTFGFRDSAIRSAWIETDRLARYASDHFPIGLEISLQG
jgi:exodeoxyribonuclease-3